MRNLFLLGLLIPCFSTFAQRDIELSHSIEWTDSQGGRAVPTGQIGFDGAVWDSKLPMAQISRELQTNAVRAEVILTDISSEIISKRTLTSEQFALLPTQLVIEPRVILVEGRSVLEVSILPVWYDPETGEVKRLLRFDADVVLTPGRRAGTRALTWEDNSVFNEGEWYKFSITADGVYRIDETFLADLGVDVPNLNKSQINIYGNGGELLPFDNNIERPDDPRKNAIFVSDEQDELFQSDDFILFYGKGPDSWKYNEELSRFEHNKHFYSDSAFYFIRVDDVSPLRIQMGSSGLAENVSTNAFSDRQFVESENVSLGSSGREFYGDRFDLTLSIPYVFSTPNLLDEPASLECIVAVRSLGVSSTFTLSAGGEAEVISPAAVSEQATSLVAREGGATINFTPGSGNTVNANLSFSQGVPDAEGWLDYLRLNMRRSLDMVGGQMHFRDPQSVAAGNVVKFNLGNAATVFQLWDISNHTQPILMPFAPGDESNSIQFVDQADELKEYIAFANFNYLEPTPLGSFTNQNLHGVGNVDMVILTNDMLLPVAEDYMALHEGDGLEMVVVNIYDVFNEFSSGNPDPTAVKMFMKMLYDRASGNAELEPRYLQIIGDGTFRNRNLTRNSKFMMTYQSLNSLSPTASYVSDDYFGFLGDLAGEALGDSMQIGVGRIPCETVSEGRGYLNKLANYMSENTNPSGDAYCIGDEALSPYGAWRNDIVFISDDLDGNGGPFESSHMNNSEAHFNRIREEYNDYNVVKIYMDAYQQETTPGGERYPEAEDAIRRRVQNGAFIVNYIGHGGEKGFAHERVLNTTTIQEWTNFNRLPVFVTATCELARYDLPEFKSAGELLVMNENGGAIGMLTTTRIVFSGGNQQLNTAFFKIALEDEGNPDLRLGDICKITKNDPGVSDVSNKRNFTLLGDVALRMSYPEHQVYTTEMNGVEMNTLEPDTVRSLQQVTFKGFVGDANGVKLTDFNGFVYPSVFDKISNVTTLNNDGGAQAFEFELFKNIIYKGKASVVNGDFEFTFIIPRDIAYNFGTGRVSYYAVAGSQDAHGHSEEFVIGGALDGAELNEVGPEVNLFLNDSTFVFGGITSEDPILFARVFDENGINTVGSGIGHDLKAIIDGESNAPIVLNDFYEADLDTYQRGSIRYQLTDLSEGMHNLSLKVWDVHNNSSESYTEFVVANSSELALNHVLNYPNPFTTRTQFMFEHNQACTFLDVQVQVFTVSGKVVKNINRIVRSEGFRGEPIEWDGLDDYGDQIGKGVYVYRVKVVTPEGQTAEKFEKLVILK